MSDLDDTYVDQIKRFEGFEPRPKWDVNAWRSGYGTRSKTRDEVVDEAEADARLRSELGSAASQVDRKFPNLAAGPRAALTSLTFNAGPSWMSSGLGDAVAKGDWDTARKLFLQYNKSEGQVSQGLASRRAAEAAWLSGEPGKFTTSQVINAMGGKASDLPKENALSAMQVPTLPAAKQRSMLELFDSLSPQTNDLRSLYLS